MLKYYSYYNVGGYKDMYLGNSSMKDDKTYFLPLLPIWRKKAQEGDKNMESRVKFLETLPMIKIITKEENQGLPSSAKVLFSHGGYKVILMSVETGETIFAIRDIESNSRDESGRAIPFLMVIVGNTDSEKATLCKIAAYASSHLDTFSKKLSELFSYDSEKNGISFELSTLTTFISKTSNTSSNVLLTMKGEYVIECSKTDVPLLILPEGIDRNLAIQEQALLGKKVNTIEFSDIVPLDNNDRLISLLKQRANSATSVLSNKKMLCLLGGSFVVGFILGYIIAKQ